MFSCVIQEVKKNKVGEVHNSGTLVKMWLEMSRVPSICVKGSRKGLAACTNASRHWLQHVNSVYSMLIVSTDDTAIIKGQYY